MSGELMIPVVYYPLKVLFVDDNAKLLQSLAKEFSTDYSVQTTSVPEDAIRILNEQASVIRSLFTDSTIDAEMNLTTNDMQISQTSLTLNNILALANNPHKYDKIGIVITDFEMPGIDGISLCNRIENPAIQTILLTGKLDSAKAVRALSDKEIDCYLEKSSDTLNNDILYYIEQLHQRYFNNLTRAVFETTTSKLSFLNDTKFVELFNDIGNKYKIKEHYLIDKNGSFLLVAENKQKFVLIVHNDDSLDEFCEIFKHEKSVAALVNGVRTRELIPFFGITVDRSTISLSDWHRHFYKANKHDGFYWHVVGIS